MFFLPVDMQHSYNTVRADSSYRRTIQARGHKITTQQQSRGVAGVVFFTLKLNPFFLIEDTIAVAKTSDS